MSVIKNQFLPNMPPKRKVVIQSKDSTKIQEQAANKDESVQERRIKRFRKPDAEDEVVDYGEEQAGSLSESHVQVDQVVHSHPTPQTSPEEEEKTRVTRLLESWCKNNISKDSGDDDANERISTLAEVGLLLVLDFEKYNSADSMRSELEDIGSIIGGEQVVTRYINFILSLQNQLKKMRVQAERQLRHQQHIIQQVPLVPGPFHPLPQFTGHGMPMLAHPGGHPHQMFGPGGPHPMYVGTPGFPVHPPAPARGNMTLNATGELTAVEKQREKERKRKEILAECTEHLKALLERVTKSHDPAEKAKIYELIDKVKKRIESLKEISPSTLPAKAAATKGSIRGYYGNQYVNPKILEQQQLEASEKADQ